jgi:ABC-2 type transport system permease protein
VPTLPTIAAPLSGRAFWAYFRAGFQRHSAYRLALLSGVVTNLVFGFAKTGISSTAVTAANGNLNGYSLTDVISNAWLVQGLLSVVYLFLWDEFAQRVLRGDIAIDLSRPIDLQFSWMAADLGRAAVMFLPRAGPPLLIGVAFFGVRLPINPGLILLGLCSITLAVLVSFSARFLVNLSAFWLLEIRGLLTLYLVLSTLLSGMLIPVPWFPDWLLGIAQASPFPAMLQIPVDILSGRLDPGTAGSALAQQTGWFLALVVAGRLVLARAVRKLVIQGG